MQKFRFQATMTKEWLFGKTLAELEELVVSRGYKKFTARQITDWLYKKQAVSLNEMTNLSLKMREELSADYEVGHFPPASVQCTKKKKKKYLFPTLSGGYIESAYIPDKDRATLCVSSQVGCKMHCLFCMTGRQGFAAHLSAGEILNQIRSIPESTSLTNIVYMGMGEPLDNPDNVLKSLEIMTSDWGFAWSPTRITLSSIGIIPAMKRFITESKVHLAISLHSPFDKERLSLMPVQNKYKIADVIAEIKKHDFSRQRRVSFEYILFKGLNDTPKHAAELGKLLKGLECRINLIRFHRIPDSPLSPSDETTIQQFKEAMNKQGIITTVRASRGEDIFAACGMLSTQAKNKIK